MDFLVDQPVSRQVAQALVTAGHDAVHVAEIGMAGAADSVILRRATDEKRIIVTQDTDFGTLLAASGADLPSVILFRMRDGRPSSQSKCLLDHLGLIGSELERGSIIVIGDASIRIRRLPVS